MILGARPALPTSICTGVNIHTTHCPRLAPIPIEPDTGAGGFLSRHTRIASPPLAILRRAVRGAGVGGLAKVFHV